MKNNTRFWIALGVLALLSPLGIIIPAYFHAGSAWGEGDAGKLWHAPLANYAVKGMESNGLAQLSMGYILSAIVGMVVVAGVMWILGLCSVRFIARRSQSSQIPSE